MKDIKLKNQITFLIVFSVIMIIVIEIFYYYFISTAMKKRIADTGNEVLEQVANDVTMFTDKIGRSAEEISNNMYVQKIFVEENPNNKMIFNDFFSNITQYVKFVNTEIYNIIISDLNGNDIKMSSHVNNVCSILEEKYNAFSSSIDSSIFYQREKNIYDGMYYYANVFPIYLSVSCAEKKNIVGTCTILICEEEFSTNIKNTYRTPNSTILIQNKDDIIIAADPQHKNMIGQIPTYKYLNHLEQNKPVVKTYDGKESIIQMKNIEKLNFRLISIIPMNEISDDLNPAKNLGLVAVLFVIVVFLIMGKKVNNLISQPILALVAFMQNVDHNTLSGRLGKIKTYEINQIAVSINKMLDEIETMTKKIFSTQITLYDLEISQKQAELSALQSQINPHFLYNTLDCIKGIAYSYKSKEIVKIVDSLAKILRYSIKSEEKVLVKAEVESIMDYLNIIDIRFMSRFTINISIDSEILELTMAKFLLQPIVENSIYHGLEPKIGKGLLKIIGILNNDGNIVFEIEDDGKGMTKEEVDDVTKKINDINIDGFLLGNSTRSVGIANINYRIKNVYGPQYGLKIDSIPNQGTKVTIEFPPIKGHC